MAVVLAPACRANTALALGATSCISSSSNTNNTNRRRLQAQAQSQLQLQLLAALLARSLEGLSHSRLTFRSHHTCITCNIKKHTTSTKSHTTTAHTTWTHISTLNSFNNHRNSSIHTCHRKTHLYNKPPWDTTQSPLA